MMRMAASADRRPAPGRGAAPCPPAPAVQVQRWQSRQDGVLTSDRLRQRLRGQGLWVVERRYVPGTPYIEGANDYDWVEVILAGRLEVGVRSKTVVLAVGDAAFVPRGAARVARVVGSSPVLTYTGAFLPDGPRPHRPSEPLVGQPLWR